MPDYSSNSHKSKGPVAPEQKHVERITTGEVVTKKKPLGRKVKDLFIAADFRSVTQYVTQNVLLPAARNMLVDASSRGMERLIYGETAARRSPTNSSVRVNYGQPVQRQDPRVARSQPMQFQRQENRRSFEMMDYILSSRNDADRVLEALSDIASQYGCVTVADLNQMVGREISHVDNKLGWEHIGHARVVQMRDGYLLDLPPTIEL